MPTDLKTLEQIKQLKDSDELQLRSLATLEVDRKAWDGKWQWAKKTLEQGTGTQQRVDDTRAGLEILQAATIQKRDEKETEATVALDLADTAADEQISLAQQMITTAKRQKVDHGRARQAVEDRLGILNRIR